MNIETALHWVQEMLTAVVTLSAPPLIGALIVGLAVAIFQAATSIQELTLSYVPKMVVVALILFFSFGFMLNYAVGFMESIFEIIPELAN
ncbi:flagellar biosynthesis protein FliQ [Aliifodinibius salicampi]|uniref:Flagellar biosynthetic protein FliQ n=1 Tax=Fodinibius salicampi TaxID=1920655 RepID=A0ABT3Q0J2_9BACT|nr:flagellar biosynthesis protein FliQ [Fodinibius salicampi]MCW9713607.1 flagellar biosynthesis protein FliQ [Fodinibius salicampi]